MASGSGSSSRGGRGSASAGAGGSSSSRARAVEAPSAADAAPLAPQLNPTFLAMPADDLVAHLNRFRRTDDFVDAALVLVARERCLAEAVGLLRTCNEDIDKLLETEATLRAKLSQAAETEAALRAKISQGAETEATLRAKISQAAETEAELWTMICTTQEARVNSLISVLSGAGAGLTQQQATGPPSREPVLPQDYFITDGAGGSHENDATRVQHAMIFQGEVGGGDAPMKTRHIGARDDTAGHGRVSEEAAQLGEDMASSLHRRSKGKVPTRATKLGAAALISSRNSGLGLTQQAAGHGREPVPQDSITRSTDAVVGGSHDAIGVQQNMIADEVPTKTSHIRALWSRPAPHLAAQLMRHGALSRAAPHLTAATMPSKLIIDDKERATMEQVATQVLNSNSNSNREAQQGNREVSEDILSASRDTTGPNKVSEEVAQGEDVAASLPQGKQTASATKKPRSRRHKRTLQPGAAALIWSGIISEREAGAQDFVTASDDGVGSHDATDAQMTMFAQGEIIGDNVHVPMEMTSNTALQPVVAPPPETNMMIDDDERATEGQVATNVLSSNQEAQGDCEVSEDVLKARVTKGVSETEAQGEDMAVSCHRRSQGEEEQQAARATKRARKYKGPSFHNMVLNALKKKEELLKKEEEEEEEEERLAKKAAASASKQVHCRCWLSAPYI